MKLVIGVMSLNFCYVNRKYQRKDSFLCGVYH